MGRIARRVVESRFSIDLIAAQHAGLYDRLAAGRRTDASRLSA
jgi:hypothetical protein